jgi:hypothetical protein
MIDETHTVTINRPVKEVFDFVADPTVLSRLRPVKARSCLFSPTPSSRMETAPATRGGCGSKPGVCCGSWPRS